MNNAEIGIKLKLKIRPLKRRVREKKTDKMDSMTLTPSIRERKSFVNSHRKGYPSTEAQI